MTHRMASAALVLCLAAVVVGCGEKGKDKSTGPLTKGPPTAEQKEKKIAEWRAKLDAADRALVEAQDYCPMMPEVRLGERGMIRKVMVKDKPVFVCCKSCVGTANDDPDATLKAVEELKAKKK